MALETTWIPIPTKGEKAVKIRDKNRQLEYNEDLNLYKRKRTFDGINHLKHWGILDKYFDFNEKVECLEIGSHEGQAAMYFLHRILKNAKSTLMCCDPWIKSHWLEINPTNLCYEDVFDFNVENNNGENKIIKYDGTNTKMFKEPWFDEIACYDIIYIDDDHTYKHTVENIKNCWPKVKEGGVMIFDDYDANHFVNTSSNPAHDIGAKYCIPVKKAVDEFIENNKQNLTIIHKHYQILIRKNHLV